MKKSKDSSKHKEESLEESEDDDYEQDEFENDSFLVGDEEVEEDELFNRPRLNLNAENYIGEAELEGEVGSSDNEVIYEQHLNKKKSRLKKHRMTEEEYQEQAKINYANEQQENLRSFISNNKKRPEKFIEDEEEDENDFIEKNEDDYISRENRKIITGNKSLAHKIFTRDINEYEEPLKIKTKEFNNRNILMRDDLAEDYMRPEDIEIKKTDVPERILLKFKGCNLEALKQSIDSEAYWILEKIQSYFSNTFDNQMVSTKKKIEAVLEFHKKNLDDIPYIVTYRRNIYEPELSPKDIWKIFELDREWNILFEMKYNLSKAFDNIKKIALSDDRADYMYIRFIENAKSITELNDMETFIDFLKEMHYNEFQNLSEEFSKNLRPNKSSQIQNFRKYNIDKFSKIFAFGAFELSANLEALANGDQNTIVSPPEPEVQPEKLAEDYICPIFDLEIKVMTAGCKFLALELFSFPFIRNYARISFKTQCTISTDPTEEGKKELDAFHPSFRVKRVRNKPIETFNNDLFLDILESEKKGWITLTVNFGDNFFKDLTEKLNHTYHSKLKTSEVDSVAHGWRVMREETIRIFVAEHCIPYFKKEVKQELKEKAENFVLNQCAVNFSKMLMNGPYRKKKKNFNMHKDEELLKEEEYPRVLSAIYDNAKNEVYVAMLDNSGETLEVCKFVNFMTKPLKLLSEGERDLKKEDEDKLKFIIQEHKPDLIVIGANDLKCKYLKEHIGSLDVEGLRESDEHKIWTTYGDVTIPRISANCPKVEKLLVNLNYFFRQAICLARFKQNPLAEICQLWHEEPNKNFCLSLPLHALQRSVSPTKLLEFLESEAVKVVNSVGVDINKSCEHQHLQSVIQFVSGLGTRKAHYLIDKLSRNHTLFMRVMLATPPKILGDIVFYNCAGFLKVKRSRDSQICDFNPLDVTRIHPENYPLANKIALSAMDDNFKDSSSEAIKIILKDPKRINILDLDEYIKTSQEKGNKYTKFNIYFIKNEFQNPFCDERPPHKDLTSSELFYLLIGDPTFKKGQMVNATVLRVDEEHVKCRLTNDLEATIWYKDVFEDSDIRPDEEKIREMKETFKPGMVVNARVKSINEVNFKIDLTIKHSELLSVKNHMDVNRIQYNYFVLVENEDYVNVNFIKENKAHQTKYQPRNINYPYFKNYTYKSSIDTLRDKKIGAYIFRPSSKGSNFLTLSWKFYDNAYSHIEIQEEEKHLGMQIGKKLRIGSEEYGSLLEIADRYLKPCELLVKDAINSRKFKKFDSIEELENKLKEEKSNKNYTPYMFTILSEFPQYIVMGHCAKVAQVIKEFIKVKPNGLFFHNEYFPNLEDLANWFKRNYTTDYYRDYLRRVKPPQVENRKIISLADENNINFDFGAFSSHLASGSRNNLEERNSVLGSVAGSSYDRERNYQTDQKSYRDRGNKAGKPCHICKEIGHLMNECPNRGSRSFNRDYNKNSDSRGNRFSRDDQDFISHKRNRSPNNSEYSGHKSVRREEKTNTWISDDNKEDPKISIKVSESWGSVDVDTNTLENKEPQTNNFETISAVKDTSEMGWGCDQNLNNNQSNNFNSQTQEIGWTSNSIQNSVNNINNSNSNRNNKYSGFNNERNFNNNRSKCHNCGEEGHFEKNCSNPPRIDNNRRDNQRGNDNFRKPFKCFNCNEDGHMAKECTKPKNKTEYRSRNDSGNYNRRDSNNNKDNYNRRDRNNFNNFSNNDSSKNNQHEKPVENSWANSELYDLSNENKTNQNKDLNQINTNNVEKAWGSNIDNNQNSNDKNENNTWGAEKTNNDNNGW